MKLFFLSKTLIALAVAVIATADPDSLALAQPVSSSAHDGLLPANIPLGSPAGQVLKLAQAGVDVSVIQSYISNSASPFNLDADKIISLTDAGVSSDMVSAMFVHDKTLPLTAVAAAAPVASEQPEAPEAPVANTDNPPVAPPGDANLNDINQTLVPYGSWVQVDGYGRCWRPNVVVYDATWRPYCDRGRWVYTDCGWYWNSDYAWGVTFHYGRWFNDARYGWCWWPDKVWSPSWVTWRSSNEYCGWAPLPPFSAYRPGIGFSYRGNNVSVNFGFGLAENCFNFISVGHFCEPQPRYYCVPQRQMAQVYNQTTIINNYGFHNRTIVNNGVSVTIIGTATRHPIQPVAVGTMNNYRYRSWQHGQNVNPHEHHFGGASNTDGSGNRQFAGNGFHRDGVSQNDNRHVTNDNNHLHYAAPLGPPVSAPARYATSGNNGRYGGWLAQNR